jgi:hypothetical protein
MRTRRSLLPALLALSLLAPAAAGAKDDDDIERAGTCTGASSAEIKLSAEDGRIETEFEVDQNRNGVRWNVVLKRNGVRVASTVATTRGPSGSFEVRRLLADGAGDEAIRAKATSPSGEVCTARATFR